MASEHCRSNPARSLRIESIEDRDALTNCRTAFVGSDKQTWLDALEP